MKVIHLIGGGDTGGAKPHVLNLLYRLNRRIDAELFCFMKGEFSEEAAAMNIPITVIESGNPRVGVKAIKKKLKNQKVDLIHCHGARGNLMGELLKGALNAPVISTVHSDYRLDYLGRPAARLSYGSIYMLALRKVDYYVGVSDSMTELLIDRKFPADRIYTIYNGIDFTVPTGVQSREAFFEGLNFSVAPGDIVAGIVARLHPVKDIPTLLRAMKTACAQVQGLKLVIAGDGQDLEALQAQTRELGLTDRVCFAGWVSDINSFYNAIDINLLTSISETFPYALTEGVRMGRPTIASRVGGVPVLIDDGINGLIFEPGDDKQLAAHLVTLANHGELRREMAARLYQKASKAFSIDTMVETQLKIYKSVLQRTRRNQGRKRDGIIICGAYGDGNAGDEAILKSIIQSVQQADPIMPITILAKDPLNIRKKFRVNAIYTFHLPKMYGVMRRSLLYINGGGSLIQNVTSGRSLAYYLMTLTMAHFTRNKVFMYGCGIGPVTGDRNIRRVTRVLNKHVDAITLREPHSMKELRSYGVNRPKLSVTSDPALILKSVSPEQVAVYFQKKKLDQTGHYICFMLRDWQAFQMKAKDIADCANRIYREKGLTPVFLAMNVLRDPQAAEQVIRHMEVPYRLLEDQLEPEMLIGVLSCMDVVAAMRLHGLIFSAASGTPMVGISYDPKIDSFMAYLGYGQYMSLEDVTAEKLYRAVLQEYEKLPERDTLRQKAERLEQREQMNGQMLKTLLGLDAKTLGSAQTRNFLKKIE